MRLVFGYQKSLELLTRGGFASTSIAQNRLHFIQQQEPLCLLSRKLQRKECKARQLCSQVRGVASTESPSGFAPALPKPVSRPAQLPNPPLAYELVQGALVRWSEQQAGQRPPPTAVMVHGILGSRKNMQAYAHRLVEGFPAWQVLLVDIRCHGESANLPPPPGPHGVESSAQDILKLLSQLKLFPEVLIGHSFGGKVVMSMGEQFGASGKRLPRPVQVWVLDALPGEVRTGGRESQDHPAALIAHLQHMPMPLPNRTALQNDLLNAGFSLTVARWASTNLRPLNGDHRKLVWALDLDGIADMYESYETANLWSFITGTPEGLRVSFVKAEHSTFRWAGPEQAVISSHGHAVHTLHKSGHWVHADNPDGLFQIMAPYFGAADLHVKKPSAWPARSRSG